MKKLVISGGLSFAILGIFALFVIPNTNPLWAKGGTEKGKTQSDSATAAATDLNPLDGVAPEDVLPELDMMMYSRGMPIREIQQDWKLEKHVIARLLNLDPADSSGMEPAPAAVEAPAYLVEMMRNSTGVSEEPQTQDPAPQP